MEFIARVGKGFSDDIAVITIVIILFGIYIQWPCGVCGKINTTNVLKYILQWCDHEGASK